MTATAVPTVDSLARLRRRLDHGRELLGTYDQDEGRWQERTAALTDLQLEYGHGVMLLRRSTTHEELQARAVKGMAILDRLWDAEDDDTFEVALARYQVLMDADYGADVLRSMFESQMRILRVTRDYARQKDRVPAPAHGSRRPTEEATR